MWEPNTAQSGSAYLLLTQRSAQLTPIYLSSGVGQIESAPHTLVTVLVFLLQSCAMAHQLHTESNLVFFDALLPPVTHFMLELYPCHQCCKPPPAATQVM